MSTLLGAKRSASAPDENIDIGFPVQALNSHLKEQAHPILSDYVDISSHCNEKVGVAKETRDCASN